MKQPAPSRLAAAAAVLGMLAAGALLLPRSPLPDSGAPSRIVVPDLPAFFDALVLSAVFVVVVGVAVLVLVTSGGINPERAARRRRRSVGAVVLLVLAALVIVLFSSPDGAPERDTRSDPSSGSVASTSGPGDGSSKESSRGLGWLLSVVVVVAVAGGSVALWRAARRHVPETAGDEELERRVLAGLDRAIRDLEEIEDPRAAVIACYGRLRDLAAAAGIAVRPADTALELLETLVERVPVLAPPSGRLVALFQEARFSPHTIDADMRRIALEALNETRDRLGARA